ncbi:PDDEXK family nuclease [Hymenobacter baengnokdamensis]|uniref:hypothetical protein n=1 Tax=Hymenobacter baengnokdamensis TaxID=2615203 RepID=UPI0012463278|nr:hypothetical protein [Hymenobacter baengnokdamensis]
MAFFRVGQQGQLTRVAASGFAELGLKERQDLQVLLRNNSEAISPDLFVFAEEFSNWQESKRRVDLLALDRKANLVVIELKRVEEGGHMELQALRYAAMLSTVDFPQVVEAYKNMIKNSSSAQQQDINEAQAEQKILDFLGVASSDEVLISDKPRIILMAPSFSKEMTTTVLWLNERGLDIRCLSVEPYKVEGNVLLEIQQILPLPSATEYVVKKREKEEKAEKQLETQKRRARTLPTLLAANYLHSGSILELIRLPKNVLKQVPHDARLAKLLDENQVEWLFNNQVYSLSGLCNVICAKFAPNLFAADYAFAGPDNWARQGDVTWLSDVAKKLESEN